MYSKVRYITPEAPPSPRVRKMANNTYVGNKNPTWAEKAQGSGLGFGVTPSQWASIRVSAKRIARTLKHLNDASQILLDASSIENTTTTALTIQYMANLLKAVSSEIENIIQILEKKGEHK